MDNNPCQFKVQFAHNTEPAVCEAVWNHVNTYFQASGWEEAHYNQIEVWPRHDRKTWVSPAVTVPDDDPNNFNLASELPAQRYLVIGYWNATVPTSGYGEYIMIGATDWKLWSSDLPQHEDLEERTWLG